MSSQGTVSLAPLGYTINLVDPEYIGYKLVITSTVCTALSGIFLCLRIYTRKFLVHSLGWDDSWMLLAWMFAVALTIGDCLETAYGMGYHLWDISITHFDIYLKLQLFVGAAYIGALAFVKISICSFYLRLSPDKLFRLLVFILIGFTGAYSLAGFLVLIFSCNPVAASWDLSLAALPTTSCINRPAEYLAQSSLNILTDVCVFLLPLHTVWNLHLPFRQKLGVSLIFALGLLACIVSIIRLKSVVVVLNSQDPSWDTNELLIWSTIEVHTTIIAACIATLKPFAKRFFPKLLGQGSSGGNGYATMQGKGTKMNAGVYNNQSFPLHNYGDGHMGQHIATVTTKAGRDPRRRDGDAESQESIMRVAEHDVDSKEGVTVTRTVQIS